MLKFFELAPSPNNTKVRMALRYKGIPFQAVDVDGAQRGPVLDVSGQVLTPVIQDKGVVIVDSEAILQYLDANYRDTPRLFPAERDGRKACDRWKERIDKDVAAHWVPVFFFVIGRVKELDASAPGKFRAALAVLDKELGAKKSFHDDPQMAVCDLRVAEWATYAFPGAAFAKRVPVAAKVAELMAAPVGSLPNLERFLAPWQERLA